MMAKFHLTKKAVEDLTKIYEYTLEFWSENQADKYYRELIDYCRRLAESPKIGKKYKEVDNQILGFPANKHIIFYRVIEKNEIEVIRILGGNMDLKNRMKE